MRSEERERTVLHDMMRLNLCLEMIAICKVDEEYPTGRGNLPHQVRNVPHPFCVTSDSATMPAE
jgi:hypothetical protein